MSLDVHLNIDGDTVYHANITHNLNEMARAAGIYMYLWRPEEIGVTKAGQLIRPLLDGYRRLLLEREAMQQFNSPNGWGRYENFVPFVSKYLEACAAYPDADVEADR
jgi:hypothetical protein